MKRKRAINRPMLARIESNETALIWNPTYGFRLASPRKGSEGELSLEELFLGVILSKTAEAEYMERMAAEHFGRFTKH